MASRASLVRIQSAASPSATLDAATKNYVDITAQPVDSDLTTIAGLTATTDSFMQAKSSAWAARTIAQVKTDLAISNVDNTSDANKPISTAGLALSDGYVGQDVVTASSPTSASTTEVLLNSVTFTAGSTRRYRFEWSSSMGGTVANDLVQMKVRWAVGSSVTSSGTLVHSRYWRILTANNAQWGLLIKAITGLTSGQVTLGVFGYRSAGTGTITWDGATDSERVFLVEDIGT